MREKINAQTEIDFQPSTLKLTNAYYAKYESISSILDDNPTIVDAVHRDLKKPLKYATVKDKDGRPHRFTSDQALRVLLCQIIEGASLREIVIRIDDSNYLRRFARIYNGPMMDFTTLDKLKNSIPAKTWKKVNELLAQHAVQKDLISGEKVRLDTTAVETNIHYPTDSTLLWDTGRVLSRLIERARELDPQAVGDKRLHPRRVKRLAQLIGRKAGKEKAASDLKPLYKDLIGRVEAISEWAGEVRQELATGKELDPDFVDFNSVNRRYHFPARVYLPFRGVFSQIDPPAWRNREQQAVGNVYSYVNSNPNRLVDSFGFGGEDPRPECQEKRKKCLSAIPMVLSLEAYNREKIFCEFTFLSCLFTRGAISKQEYESKADALLASLGPLPNLPIRPLPPISTEPLPPSSPTGPVTPGIMGTPYYTYKFGYSCCVRHGFLQFCAGECSCITSAAPQLMDAEILGITGYSYTCCVESCDQPGGSQPHRMALCIERMISLGRGLVTISCVCS